MPHLEHIIHLSYILAHHSVELGVDTYLHHTFAKISAGMDSMGVQSFYNSFLSDSPVENLSSYGYFQVKSAIACLQAMSNSGTTVLIIKVGAEVISETIGFKTGVMVPHLLTHNGTVISELDTFHQCMGVAPTAAATAYHALIYDINVLRIILG